MKLTKYFMPLAAVALLASCSDDKVVDQPANGLEDSTGLYLSVNIAASVNTRTASPANGQEYGQANENKINSATIVLTYLDNTDNKYKVISSADLEIGSPDANNVYKSQVAEFKQKTMLDFIGSENYEKGIYVFVVANPTTSVGAFTVGSDVQQQLASVTAPTVTSEPTTGPNIMMTGWLSSSITSKITSETVKAATTKETAIEVGEVPVRRAVARLDLSLAEANTKFYFKDGKAQTSSSNADITIEMKGVALVNQSNTELLFKEVGSSDEVESSPTWAWNYAYDSDGETSTNFVNDYKSDAKIAHTYAFTNPFFTESKVTPLTYGFTPYTSAGIVGATNTTGNGYTGTSGSFPEDDYDGNYWNGYKAWTYCVPNSLLDPTKQDNGASTGIVFAATITGAKPTSASTGKLYTYGNIVIGGISDLNTEGVREDANANQYIVRDYKAALESYSQVAPSVDNDEFCAALVENGFRVYDYQAENAVFEGSSAGHYCFYYYWNRHNDNGNPSEMGPMEFAVVRNNVYKLAVTKVSGLGHTPDPDDPDQPDPDTPDESDPDTYLTVDVKVLPWTVRENNIEF